MCGKIRKGNDKVASRFRRFSQKRRLNKIKLQITNSMCAYFIGKYNEYIIGYPAKIR